MIKWRLPQCLILVLLITACQPSAPEDVQEAMAQLPDQIDFNMHVKPILSDRCFACHGPDEKTREGDLRLDLEEHAFGRLPNILPLQKIVLGTVQPFNGFSPRTRNWPCRHLALI